MEQPFLTLSAIAGYLHRAFAVDRYPADERGGVYRSADAEQPVRRLGLALEPWSGLPAWVAAERLDAVWLHRPWQLDAAALPPGLGVLFNHLPFDEHLTIGYNSRLAAELGTLGQPEPIGFKQAATETGERLSQRTIGMLFDVAEAEFDQLLGTTAGLFGGYDRAEAGRQLRIGRVAVVGAMNDSLIREAAGRGANVYVTGQYRKPGQEAVDETGLAVIAVGHRRSEEWGLRALADLLRRQWPELIVSLP